MLRNLKFLLIGLCGFLLVLIALSNRAPVTVRLMPEDMGGMLGLGAGWTMPLFVVILLTFALGMGAGFLWEWLREMRLRSTAKQQVKAVQRLEREVANLKTDHNVPPADKVLAILEKDNQK